jgi:hypothetical protein
MKHQIQPKMKSKCESCSRLSLPSHWAVDATGWGSHCFCASCCPECNGKSAGLRFKSYAGVSSVSEGGVYRYFRTTRVSESQLKLAKRIAEQVALAHKLSTPEIWWFESECQLTAKETARDRQEAESSDNFTINIKSNGCFDERQPGAIWISAALEGAELVKVVTHEVCHASGCFDEKQATECGKKWAEWWEREGCKEGNTYRLDHRPKPWEQVPGAKLKFGDRLIADDGSIWQNYSASMGGALWSEIR